MHARREGRAAGLAWGTRAVLIGLAVLLAAMVPTVAFGAELIWAKASSPVTVNLQCVHFVDANTGWAVGDGGTILKSVDGGTSWTPQDSGSAIYFTSVYFADANTGWAIGAGGILKTVNGGADWDPQTTPISALWWGIEFLDANTGWAVGFVNVPGPSYGPKILKTVNGGSTWTTQTPSGGEFLYDVRVESATTAWVAGYPGVVMKTVNGGADWVTQVTHTAQPIYGFDFLDKNKGWFATDKGEIAKTTDGGDDWVMQDSGTTANLYGLDFADASRGWVVGVGGLIRRSIDGGSTWTTQTCPTTENLYDVHFLDADTGWAVGAKGTILKGRTPMPVWRFYNFKQNTHFYTADPGEKQNVIDHLSNTYRFESVAYEVNTLSADNVTPLYRFYNFKKNTHFYTANPDEKQNVIDHLSNTYRFESVAYNVCATNVSGSTPVWRFYNFKKNTHFYTANPDEKQNVIDHLSNTYRFEGPAFYIAP